MKLLTLSVVTLAITLAGCADLQKQTGMDGKTAGAAGGAAIGCIGGPCSQKLADKTPLAAAWQAR